jgi:hypothetical protein
MSENPEKLISGYRELAAFLNGQGFRTSASTLTKYCSPAVNIGPPSEGYWGKYQTFKPSRVLEWARGRMRSAGKAPAPKTTRDMNSAAHSSE